MTRKARGIKDRKSPNKPGEGGEGGWQAPLPPWAPYVLFAVLSLALFREFIVSGDMLFGEDVVALGYFARKFYAEQLRQGIFPLWNPLIFGGLPFVDATHGDIFYPTTILKAFMPVHRAMGWKLVLHVFLAGVFTYHWLKHLKLSRPVATFGGAVYLLAPVLVTLIYPGHDGKLFVTALTPLALLATDRAMVRGGIARFAALALVVALLIYTPHMQLAYFTTWAMTVLAVFRLVQAARTGLGKREIAGRFALFATAGIIGALAIGAAQLWTPVKYLTEHSRRVERTIEGEAESRYAYSTSWSLHPEEVASLVVPEFIGGNLITKEGRISTYWGRNPFKLNHEYGGLIPLLLLPLAFFRRRRRAEKWLFTGIAAAALIYAVGATTPLFYLFYWLVPGVELFRAPSSISYIFVIAVLTVSAFGLEATRRSSENEDEWEAFSRRTQRYLLGAAASFLLLALLASSGLLTRMWVAVLYSDIGSQQQAALAANLPNIKLGFWISFAMTGLIAAAWYLRVRGTVKEAAWLALVIVVAIVDVSRVNGKYIQVFNPNDLFPRDDTIEFLAQQKANSDPFRVFVLPNAPYRPNHLALYGIEQVAGHHGNELARYRQLTGLPDLGTLVQQDLQLLRLLNVRYIVSGAPIQAPRLREAFRGRRSIIYQVLGSAPRAFLASDFEVVADSFAVRQARSAEFDPILNVLLSQEPSLRPQPGADARVEWIEQGVNRSVLSVEASGPGFLVITDNWYPSWQAEVDGEPAAVLRADVTLRAVPVPAGSHEVRLVYGSDLFSLAVWVSLGSLLIVLSAILGPAIRKRLPVRGVATPPPPVHDAGRANS